MFTQPQIAFDGRFLQGTSLEEAFLVVGTLSSDGPYYQRISGWRLLHFSPGSITVLRSGIGELKDLWVSPTKTVYLTALHGDSFELCIGRPTSSGYAWEWEGAVGTRYTYPEFVWGLSDNFVLTWGGGVLDALQHPDSGTRLSIDEPYCWVKSGSQWIQYPSPGWITRMHGRDEASIYAVGHAGLTARWCGTRWERLQDAEAYINHLQVTTEGRVYGTSNFGDLLECVPSSGWTRFVPHVGYVTGLVYWRAALYLLRESGLHRVERGRLRLVRPAIRPKLLVAGGGLMWYDEKGIHEWGEAGMRSIGMEKIAAVMERETDNGSCA